MRAKPNPQALWLKVMVSSLDDWRIAKLATKLGLDYANAHFACMRVWKRLYDRGGGVMDPDEIDAAARINGMASALLDSSLAEALAAGIRVKGEEHAEGYARFVANQSARSLNRPRKQTANSSPMSDVMSSGRQQTIRGSSAGPTAVHPADHPPSSSSSSSSSLDPDLCVVSTGNALLAGTATPPGEIASGETKKSPTARKGPKPPKAPPDAMAATVRSVTDYWSSLWSAAQGGPYRWTAEQVFAIQPLVKSLGPGEVQARMHTMIKNPPEGVRRFLNGGPPTVGAFVSCINSLASWSTEKAAAVKADPQDDSYRDDGWRRKAGLRYSELNALANRKVPAWWSEPERLAMAKDANGEPMIPLVAPGVPKNHAFVLVKLSEYIASSNKNRSVSDQRSVAEVDAWYRGRFGVKP
jgi:hypothetical protein